MAGQDIEMNNFAQVTNAEYVYVELADGSQAKMRKSAFQTMTYLSHLYNQYDVNDLNPGEVYITENAINAPVQTWVYVKTFGSDKTPDRAQLAVSIVSGKVWIRVRNGNTWMGWKSITIT